MSPEVEKVARRLAAAYAQLPVVRAVALGGSQATGLAAGDSDVDLYVYASPEPGLEARAAVAAGSPRRELGNRFFEPGDEWVDAETGLAVDAMFRDPSFIEGELDRVLVRCEARVGYSTAFWHGLVHSSSLYDPTGWYAALQARARMPYPEPLVRAVVEKNQPLLRRNLSSFRAQLARAAARGDAVSVNHRTAAFLASFFDVLFAVNRIPHPGEKRLLAVAEARCSRRPPELARQVAALVSAAAHPGDGVVRCADALGEALDRLLEHDGLLPAGPREPPAANSPPARRGGRGRRAKDR